MKLAQVTVPLAVLAVATARTAVAGPQSMLDPYSSIKPPSKQQATEKKKPRPYATGALKNPADDIPSANAAPPASKATAKKEKAAAATPVAASEEGNGFLAGTKQVFHGIGTATKGAASDLVHPAKALGGGIASGGKKVTETVATGAKTSKDVISNGTKRVGDGLKEAGGKVKDGTQAAGKALLTVPKKIGEGLKSTGEATKKVATAPLKLASKIMHRGHDASDAVQTATKPSGQQQ